jgi:hypothetical protein
MGVFSAFKLQAFKRSSRPIAAHALWCHNPQRDRISLRSGETTPLRLVSKDTRADIGTVHRRSRSQVVPGSNVPRLRVKGWTD